LENTPCIGKYPLSWKIPPVLENTLCVEKYPHIGKIPYPPWGKGNVSQCHLGEKNMKKGEIR
jgi:hypothetical protein